MSDLQKHKAELQERIRRLEQDLRKPLPHALSEVAEGTHS